MDKQLLKDLQKTLDTFTLITEGDDINVEEDRIYNNAVRLYNEITDYLDLSSNDDWELTKHFSPNERFDEDEFDAVKCVYKGYTILEARLNAHNAQYCIKELGYTTRWDSLQHCKDYIKAKLA
jgi:hypothetical protein